MAFENWKLDKGSPLPYYYQLERRLRAEIEKGAYRESGVLPAEGEIARSCDVSLGTVRQTLKRLEAHGVIVRQKGKKAVVKCSPKFQIEFSHKQAGGYEYLERQGFKVRTKVLENRVIRPDEKIQKKLGVSKDSDVVKITRIRYVEDQPVIYWVSYVPSYLCPGLDKADLNDRSLTVFARTEHGIRTDMVECSLEVVHGEQEPCGRLHKPMDEPLIYIESTNYLKNERVFQYSAAWHTVENWNFIFHLYPEKQPSSRVGS